MRLTTVECDIGVFRAFSGDLITRQLETFGAHSRPELAMLMALVRPDDIVLDVGAHIGTFAIPIARTGAKVIAFEAQAEAFALLEENARLNGVQIDARQAAIGTGDALTIDEVPGNSGATFLRPGGAARTVALDDLVARADVIKIDVEGMELEVLRSARRLITSYLPVAYLEVNPVQFRRYGATPMMIEHFLRPLGYRFFVNVGPRNVANDHYRLGRLSTFRLLSGLHDVLAIHEASDRLPQSIPSASVRLGARWLWRAPRRLARYLLKDAGRGSEPRSAPKDCSPGKPKKGPA
jgi:FkbM family methyltransferase